MEPQPPSSQALPEGEPGPADAAGRVASILEAAERTARELREQAEARSIGSRRPTARRPTA